MKDITNELEKLEDNLEWLLSSPATIEKFSNLLPAEKNVLRMRIGKATPYNEIARESGLTVEWVKRLHKSALEKIKDTVLKLLEEEKIRMRKVESVYERMKQMELRLTINEERVEQIERQLKMVHNSSHPEEIKAIEIDDVPGMPVRVRNTLKGEGIETIADLLLYKKKNLLVLRNFGKGSLKNLETLLLQYGIKF